MERNLQNSFLFYEAAGENVEAEATYCMKQLRHYACCRPTTLKGRRVQTADGELAVESKSTSGTCCVDLFLESADGLRFF